MLNDDYELSREDIQDLSSRDALAAFFAKLGYDTNDRLVQNVAAMGFTSDNLKSAITYIEHLASQDGRMFEVYLFFKPRHGWWVFRTFDDSGMCLLRGLFLGSLENAFP